MTPRHQPRSALPLAIYLVVSAAVAMAAAVRGGRRAPEPATGDASAWPVPRLAQPETPLAAEAQVFRTTPALVALEPESPRQRSAHPRTLVNYRFLRAYPGAPPRIPHALTPDEFRIGACTACHARGGYSIRFTAYVPLTPHPELGECLQCHVGADAEMGVGTAGTDPNVRCPLCHAPTGRIRPEARLTWLTSAWAVTGRRRPNGPPPPIPHDRLLRENCVACHAGPAAVAEIRTSHPERANCRQCHVDAGGGP